MSQEDVSPTGARGLSGAVRLRVAAPAKVNLTLNVRGRRADGYHEISSLVAFSEGVSDWLTADLAGPRVPLKVEGESAVALIGENLISKAERIVRERSRDLELPRAMTLDKRLPVAAGLGGGSADAAAYLRIVRTLNRDHVDNIDWIGLAAEVGADVPVCLASQCAVMWGIGERLNALSFAPPPLDAVLVNPMCAVPATKTRDVFRALAARPIPAGAAEAAPEIPGDCDEFREMVRYGHNDMEAAASDVMPAIRDVRDILERTRDIETVRLSGAGPTMFALYPSAEAAHRAADAIRSNRNAANWWVCVTRLGGQSEAAAVQPVSVGAGD